jgi:hypothetical protein
MDKVSLNNPVFLKLVKSMRINTGGMEAIISFQSRFLYLVSQNKILDENQRWFTRWGMEIQSITQLKELIKQ